MTLGWAHSRSSIVKCSFFCLQESLWERDIYAVDAGGALGIVA